MYTCPYCKIRVGGASEKCPLCQSRLFGDGEEPHFPTVENLKKRSFLYRLQLFIVLCVVIAGLGLDFLFHLEIPAFPGLHWSLILAMWLLGSEFLIDGFFQRIRLFLNVAVVVVEKVKMIPVRSKGAYRRAQDTDRLPSDPARAIFRKEEVPGDSTQWFSFYGSGFCQRAGRKGR